MSASYDNLVAYLKEIFLPEAAEEWMEEWLQSHLFEINVYLK